LLIKAKIQPLEKVPGIGLTFSGLNAKKLEAWQGIYRRQISIEAVGDLALNPSKPESPSPLIDAAICDLLAAVSHFSDENFDADWLNLNESETEFLVVNLIRVLTEELKGETLRLLLQKVRPADPDFLEIEEAF
jgi:hypothetical protein